MHFNIYPLWEYVALMVRKKATADYSLLLKLIKQLIMTLKYNIDERKDKDQNMDNVQIYPILGQNLDSITIQEVQNICRSEMNVMVIELVQFPEVYCFIIPKTIDQKVKVYGTDQEKMCLTFNKIKNEFEGKIKEFFDNEKKLKL